MQTVKEPVSRRIRQAAIRAWSEPVSRVYLVLLAFCALWAMAGGAGLGDGSWLPRHLAVILTLPWLLAVHLFLVVTQVDTWLLGYNFYAESPALLFEPLWFVYCVAAGLLNASFLARMARSARRSATAPWVVPAVALCFFAALFALWHA
ncbi:SCO4225 family membrane protein [Streptomyces sp. IBSNAI002]|uniref:SCO4225 family membrane protein n=1 Tax=Streptomyces sp. IBSNAI002 TaxID=3457500 RepID=UPI003FD60864